MLKSSYKLKWGSVQNSTTRPGSYVLLDLHNLHCTCTYRKQEHWIQFTGLDQKSGTSSQTETKQPQDNECIHSRFSTALAFYNKYFEFNSRVDMWHRVATLCSHWATACVYVWIYICSCQHMYICMNIYTYAHMRHVLSWYSHNVELFRSILNQAVNLTESVTFMRAHNLTFLTSCWKG